ncbi:MAG TPA: T9SS type A sorting domain-containing protein [Bacteroidia bacterium]|nr:T9SS type A sorting domain-containing protein [Bacteroidia bacterium]
MKSLSGNLIKNAFTCISVAIVSVTAQAQYGPVIYIDSLSNETIVQAGTADFNHDGKTDILTADFHWPYDNLRLYTNQGGLQFNGQIIPGADSLTQFMAFDTGDITNDGWPDFVATTEVSSSIIWYENSGGTFIPHLLIDSLDFATKILLRDFNNDSLLDILALQHVEVVLYLASSPGNFNPGQVIHSGTEFYAIDVNDFNNDHFPDVSVASGGFEVLLNDGAGGFTLHSQAGLQLMFGLQSGDLDNDLDNDVVAYESVTGLLFYANDGNGNFTLQDTVIESPDNFENYLIADMDCDADPDVYTSVQQSGQVIWCENDGTGNFSLPQLIHSQPGELIGAVALGDLDSDGKLDLIWGNTHLGCHINQCFPSTVAGDRMTDLALYPNPSKNNFQIKNTKGCSLKVTIRDLTGKIFLTDSVSGNENKQFSISDAGMYLVSLTFDDGTDNFVQKIVVLE